MIREQPEDFLTVIKQNYVPDPKKSIPAVRKDFSEFYEAFQSVDRPTVAPVEINGGLRGYVCSVPESLPDYYLLFFHGGGFQVGSTADHLGLITRMARACRARVLSVDYRLAPECVYPAAAEDALAGYQYLLSQGISPHRIIPVGISAGGTLVLNLLSAIRDHRMLPPAAAVCLSPVVDFTFGGESVISNRDLDWLTAERLAAIRTLYLAGQDPNNPAISPIHANMSGFPPLYIQAGSHEILFDDISAFVKKAKWAGLKVHYEVWDGMFHFWHIFGEQVPEAHEAINHIGAYVQEAFRR